MHEVEEEKGETVVEAICQLVGKKLKQCPAPSKVIVYGGSVAQREDIGEALGCPTLFSRIYTVNVFLGLQCLSGF